MKTLQETWLSVAQLNRECCQPDDNVRAMGCALGLERAVVDLASACTPRPPRPEWFGNGPAQWDSWWIHAHSGEYANTSDVVQVRGGAYEVSRDVDPYEDRDGWCITVDGYTCTNNSLHIEDFVCLPVSREGFPSPVGWGVVEVEDG